MYAPFLDHSLPTVDTRFFRIFALLHLNDRLALQKIHPAAVAWMHHPMLLSVIIHLRIVYWLTIIKVALSFPVLFPAFVSDHKICFLIKHQHLHHWATNLEHFRNRLLWFWYELNPKWMQCICNEYTPQINELRIIEKKIQNVICRLPVGSGHGITTFMCDFVQVKPSWGQLDVKNFIYNILNIFISSTYWSSMINGMVILMNSMCIYYSDATYLVSLLMWFWSMSMHTDEHSNSTDHSQFTNFQNRDSKHTHTHHTPRHSQRLAHIHTKYSTIEYGLKVRFKFSWIYANGFVECITITKHHTIYLLCIRIYVRRWSNGHLTTSNLIFVCSVCFTFNLKHTQTQTQIQAYFYGLSWNVIFLFAFKNIFIEFILNALCRNAKR